MPIIAVIGGTGLDRFPELTNCSQQPMATPYGDCSAPLTRAMMGQQQVFFLPRHGSDHSIAPQDINYRANLHALQQVGVTEIIAVNAVGGILPQLDDGALVLPNQLIDYTWGRECSFSSPGNILHVDFTEPYCEEIQLGLQVAAAQEGLFIHSGAVLGVTSGPRLETAAEVTRLARDGCGIVGMTGMPEAVLARELGIRYCCLALVVNKAAGLGSGPITMEHMTAVMNTGMQQVRRILIRYFNAIPE